MRIIANILGRMGYAKRSGTANPSQWLVDWVQGGQRSSSGVTVNSKTALQYTPFWAAVRIISGTIGALPFLVYKRTVDGKNRVTTHPVYNLLHNRPNPYMDAGTFIETRQAHALTYGNGYAEIQRDGGGRPIALWPLLPDKTFRKMSPEGVPFYEVRMSKSPQNPKGETVTLPDYNVLHIKGLGFDGYTGYNVVQFQKEAIGYGIAVKQFASRFFGNNGSPGGVLEHPNALGDNALKHLRETFAANHQGLSNSNRMMILEEGMKWQQTGVDPSKAQALQTQKYTVDDCSRIFNIPPHKLASMERATFSNIEEQNIDFIQSTMLYWFRKWEQECNYKLFSTDERKTMFCEILVDAMLRGNIKSRYEAYNVGRNAGFLSVNDIRTFENMNGIGDAGDIYLEPLNMKEAGTDPDEDPPDNDDDDDDDTASDDDINRAHRNLIISQFERVIRKLTAGERKGIRGDLYESLRKHAATIVFESVNALASMSGVNPADTRQLIGEVLAEHIQKDAVTDAVTLTDLVIQKIGESNHVIKTS